VMSVHKNLKLETISCSGRRDGRCVSVLTYQPVGVRCSIFDFHESVPELFFWFAVLHLFHFPSLFDTCSTMPSPPTMFSPSPIPSQRHRAVYSPGMYSMRSSGSRRSQGTTDTTTGFFDTAQSRAPKIGT